MDCLKDKDAGRLSDGLCVPRITVVWAHKGKGLTPCDLRAQFRMTKVLCLGPTITRQKTHDEDDTGGF